MALLIKRVPHDFADAVSASRNALSFVIYKGFFGGFHQNLLFLYVLSIGVWWRNVFIIFIHVGYDRRIRIKIS